MSKKCPASSEKAGHFWFFPQFPQSFPPSGAGKGPQPPAQGCAGAGKIISPTRHAHGRARARGHPRRMALLPGRKPPPRGTPTANPGANQRHSNLLPPGEVIPASGAPSGLLGFLPTTGGGPGLAHLPEAAPSLGRGEPSQKNSAKTDVLAAQKGLKGVWGNLSSRDSPSRGGQGPGG